MVLTDSGSGGSWSSMLPSAFTGLTSFTMFAGSSHFVDGVKLLIFGQLIELFRTFFSWLVGRFRLQYCITAEFTEGDPVYEWMIHFLNHSNVWQQTRDFRVYLKTLKRRWAVDTLNAPADYVPMYERPRLFRWKGYWVEVSRTTNMAFEGTRECILCIKIYTLDMSVLSAFIEEAKQEYAKVTHTTVTVHTVDANAKYSPEFRWANAKHKSRRPLSSLILPDGMLESLLKDARRFLASEEWYTRTGVPYRRGYLLYGPPGAGKTSTIYALAGELNLEIYTLPLSSNFLDDGFLQRAAAAIPKRSILLVEDIDCAFPSRDSDDEDEEKSEIYPYDKHGVTLSGLLNVLDGVGSEEGRLFFATTNYVDRLDPALIRPGRIDKKIEYGLATTAQAEALFSQIFSPAVAQLPTTGETEKEKENGTTTPDKSSTRAKHFAAQIPPGQLSTAELQGYLLNYRDEPDAALANVAEWARGELEEKRLRKEREEKRKQRVRENRRQARYSGYYASGGSGGPPLESSVRPTIGIGKESEYGSRDGSVSATRSTASEPLQDYGSCASLVEVE